jgi:hypothetical protein
VQQWTKAELRCSYGLRLNSTVLRNKLQKPPTNSEKLASHAEDNTKMNVDNYLMMLQYRLETMHSVYNEW